MKKLKYALILAIAGALIYFSLPSGNSEEYVESVKEQREKKEKYLRSASDGPFAKDDVLEGAFNYFPVEESYRVNARIERIEKRELVRLGNSDGSVTNYLKFANLHFNLQGQELKLVVLKQQFGVGYFLGFSDATAGEETYGGGRYLDVGELKGDRVMLDFNLAYNPYCAYSPGFQCPLPPRENVLPVRIEAGEKIYGELLEL